MCIVDIELYFYPNFRLRLVLVFVIFMEQYSQLVCSYSISWVRNEKAALIQFLYNILKTLDLGFV